MKSLTEEQLNNERVALTTNFVQAGINTESEEVQRVIDLMLTSTFSTNENTGTSFPGALACHVNLQTAIALKLAKMISGTFNISEQSVRKVCILQHVAKIEMFEPTTTDWEIKKGINYKFAETEGRLKCGERGILIGMSKLGVTLTPSEWEAVEGLDKESENIAGKFFDCILNTIIRQANELAVAIEKERYNK